MLHHEFIHLYPLCGGIRAVRLASLFSKHNGYFDKQLFELKGWQCKHASAVVLSAEISYINVLGKHQFRDQIKSGPFPKQGHVPYTLGLKLNLWN